jgi:hypothetical protein
MLSFCSLPTMRKRYLSAARSPRVETPFGPPQYFHPLVSEFC